MKVSDVIKFLKIYNGEPGRQFYEHIPSVTKIKIKLAIIKMTLPSPTRRVNDLHTLTHYKNAC